MANFKVGVGSNIKLIRKLKNITQEELAEIIGIHSRQLSKIETGEHFPSSRTLEKLCIALDVTPKEIFDFEFLVDEQEGALTGTDNTIAYRINSCAKEEKNKIKALRPNNNLPKVSTDESIAKVAQTIKKPIFVEYFDENKASKLVVFYPDGKEKVIRNSVDVEAKQNMVYIMNEVKKVIKDKAAIEFIKLSISALKNNDDLKKISNVIYGMKLARGISED